jgi:hypothetical protein
MREDAGKIIRLLNKAQDSIQTDRTPDKTEEYIRKACQIIEKYMGD